MRALKVHQILNALKEWVHVILLGLSLFFLTESAPLVDFLVFFLGLLFIAMRVFSADIKIAYLARFILFVAVGSYAYAVKIFAPGMYFSVFEFSTQNLEIARKMFALTLIGAPFCFLGLKYGEKIQKQKLLLVPNIVPNTLPKHTGALFDSISFILGLCMTLSVVVLTQRISKGNILEGAYGGSIEGTSMPLGGLNTIAGIGISIMLYWSIKKNKYLIWTLFCGVTGYYLVTCLLLRGLRQDMASLLFCVAVCFFILKYNNFKFKLKYVSYLLPLLILFEIFGIVRSGLSQWVRGQIPFSEVLKIGLGNGQYADVVYSGTLGPISSTFANTVDAVFLNNISITWGKGYLEYILRLAPEVLSPNRPEDYAHFFHGTYATGGGIFEPAEALLNFGFIGVVIVPFLVSVVYSYIYNNFESKKSLYSTILIGSLLCVFLRGAWYQTFAYVKAIEIGLFICVLQFLIFYVLGYLQKYLFKTRADENT